MNQRFEPAKLNGTGKPHPRHKNKNQHVDHGICPICAIVNEKNQEETFISELENHHCRLKQFFHGNGPKKKCCPDHHMAVHYLLYKYIEMLVTENVAGIDEINERFFAGEILTDGDLREILLRTSGR